MFLFAVCQVGAEPALKSEVAREHPELRMAFSRPGFLTFKRADGTVFPPDFELKSIFARAQGRSLGKTKAQVSEVIAAARAQAKLPLRLHVFERDRYIPGEEPKGFVFGSWSAPVEAAIRAAPESRELFLPPGHAQPGERVLDVVVVDEGDWWFGSHTHTPGLQHPAPGGRADFALPVDAPSRAYLKLREGVEWSGAKMKTGDYAVEIGSAPGGASYYLRECGLFVVGIDPAEMDPRIFRFQGPGGFQHIQGPVAGVLREDLPDPTQWLLLDMNVSPSISLYAVDRLAVRMREGLLGLLLTIKLNDWKMSGEIPSMLDHVKAMGMVKVRAKQLSANRQEIFVAGFTRQGMLRNQTIL